ncbi:hypothetical protein [Gimesia aquarii]|uniref:Transmembrane protein (PGPGW) n=1 Tax=Gimesia aquarii TaxID=2527964 RepID=A0A517W3Y4_9PLAN|nr:hypothetical protein [Gimesia aquarii]QDT99962.1 hypothetical protein V144x_54760 [Gimesia aquarii]
MQLSTELLGWLAVASVITFIGTIIMIPILVVRIPVDYFMRKERGSLPWASRHPVVRVILLTGKNLFGFLFIGVGILLLALPGQGLVTIIIGILLIDFPGKFKLERWIISQKPALRSINWLRRRSNCPPLEIPEDLK